MRPRLPVVVAAVVLAGVPVGCGRTQLSPWGTTGDAGAPRDSNVPRDGAPDLPGDGAPDAGAVPDGGGGDANTSPLACGSLAALIARGPLTPRHTRQALFTANGRDLLLRVAGASPSTDEILRVALPGGNLSTLAPGVTASEWLGNTGRLLLTRANGGALTAQALDGTFARTLLGASCAHVSSPDGTRVYALHDCDGDRGPGVLVAIDVQTGQTTTLSAAAAQGTLVVSPDSQWAAYEAGPTAVDGGAAGAAGIHVVDRGGADYPLDLRVGARRPGFTPTSALLFLTTADAAPLAVADIYRHVPGTGGGAVRVAQSRNVGTGGYHVSPDGTLLLAARFPPASPMLNELYAVRLDGSGETLVASNLAPYQTTSVGVSAFAFSADGRRVVYVSNNFSGTATVSVAGGMITPLASGGTFAVSPRGDWLAVIDPMNATKTIDTVHLIAAPTEIEVAAFGASATQGLTFLPDGRGLLYVAKRPGEPQRLLQFSVASSTIATLAEWTTSRYWTSALTYGELTPSAGYPIDPSGCYAVVDDELGTRLVLLP